MCVTWNMSAKEVTKEKRIDVRFRKQRQGAGWLLLDLVDR